MALLLGAAKSFDFHELDLGSEERLWDPYERWRSQHTVSRELQEEHNRFNVFKENVKHVHKANLLNKPYKLKLNKFADMTNHEFASTYASSKVSHNRMFQGGRSTCGYMHEKVTIFFHPPLIGGNKVQSPVSRIKANVVSFI